AGLCSLHGIPGLGSLLADPSALRAGPDGQADARDTARDALAARLLAAAAVRTRFDQVVVSRKAPAVRPRRRGAAADDHRPEGRHSLVRAAIDCRAREECNRVLRTVHRHVLLAERPGGLLPASARYDAGLEGGVVRRSPGRDQRRGDRAGPAAAVPD